MGSCQLAALSLTLSSVNVCIRLLSWLVPDSPCSWNAWNFLLLTDEESVFSIWAVQGLFWVSSHMKTTLPLLPQLSTQIFCAHSHFWDYFRLPALPGLGSAFVIGLLKSVQGKQAQIEELIAWPSGKNGNDSVMVTSYLINHHSRVGKTHWTMNCDQTILCRCLSNLFRQIFCGRRFHLCMGALLTWCSSELILVSCVTVLSQVSLLCVLGSRVPNSWISFPIYLKCSRWFPGKIFLVFLIYILIYFHLIFVLKAVLFSACREYLG